jgi:hypothetical protein
MKCPTSLKWWISIWSKLWSPDYPMTMAVWHHPLCPVPGSQRLVWNSRCNSTVGHHHPKSGARMLLFDDRTEMCYLAPTALFGLGAINRGGGRAWLKLSTLGMCCPCLVWEASNSLVLARSANPLRVSNSSALHCEITLSDTRWSSCKSVVLVTLGGCHLLDGLVVVSVEARKEDCVVFQRSDCEGYCARPAGATKSNSSRAYHWATLNWFMGFLRRPTCGLGVVPISRRTTKWTVDTTRTSVLTSTWTSG